MLATEPPYIAENKGILLSVDHHCVPFLGSPFSRQRFEVCFASLQKVCEAPAGEGMLVSSPFSSIVPDNFQRGMIKCYLEDQMF